MCYKRENYGLAQPIPHAVKQSCIMTKQKLIPILFFSLAALWLAGLAIFSVVRLGSSPQSPDKTTDAIVVLTGGQNRVDQGLILFANGKASNLFISGVHPDVKKREITGRWAGETSLPPCCIALGKTATTTIENATETADWAQKNDIESIRLVTSNYHMPRARLELQATMPDVTIIKNPIEQDDLDTAEGRIWHLLFSEYHKFLLRSVQLIFS